jgi:hypothetical protein
MDLVGSTGLQFNKPDNNDPLIGQIIRDVHY